MQDKAHEVAPALAKQLPPWGIVAVNTVSNIPLDKWLLICTMIYTLLQIYVLLRDKVFRKARIAEPVCDEVSGD